MLSGIQICLVIAETGHAMTLPGRSETYADDCKRRGFPVDIYRGDRIGLVLAFWAVALALGRVQVSQTDYTEDGTTFGSVLNHVTVGRKTHGEASAPCQTQCLLCLMQLQPRALILRHDFGHNGTVP